MVERDVDVDGDGLGFGDGDGGRGGGIFGFDAAGVARTVCCCCGGRRDIEAAAAMTGGDWSGAFEVESGCRVEDVAEGAGKETHGRLVLVLFAGNSYAIRQGDGGEAE